MRFYVTSGDPSGIGPEICLRLLADLLLGREKGYQQDEIFFLGSSAVFQETLRQLPLSRSSLSQSSLKISTDSQAGIATGVPTGMPNMPIDLTQKLFEDFVGGRIDGIKLISPSKEIFTEKFSTQEISNEGISTQEVSSEGIPAEEFSTQKISAEEISAEGISAQGVSTQEISNQQSTSPQSSSIKSSLTKLYDEAHWGSHAYNLLCAACLQIEKDLLQGRKVALITAPIDKSNIAKKADPHFLGHTEYFANRFGCGGKVTMCFDTPLFHMVLATTHIPLCDVPKALTEQCLEKAIRHALFLQQLVRDDLPLMVFGINPHAGEKGLLGTGEEVIAKVIASFCQQGAKIEGPLPADGAVRHAARCADEGKKRTLVACYHDQGLVAAKLAARDYNGVNFTLGLPFLRTSVDHGTAYEARGRADHRSLKSALAFAKKVAVKIDGKGKRK